MKKRLLIILVSLSLLFALAISAHADFGSYSGDSDYGGSSDSDWSSSSDYDGSGGDGDLIPALIWLAILGVSALYTRQKKKKQGGNAADPADKKLKSKLRSMAEYTDLDPAFRADDFTEKLSNLYVQMQNAWTAKDIEPLRPYFTDAFFTQMDRQLEQMRKQGVTNYVDRIAVLGVELQGFYQEGGEDHILATIRTRIVDYTLNDKTGKLVSGNQKKEKFMVYEWDLCRTTGKGTIDRQGVTKIICPSCGAPLDVNVSARCPYCDSVINLSDHDWAIRTIRGISQTTK